MRWQVQRPEADPNEGDKRTVRRFAWWPTLVDLDDEEPQRVWLEWYWAQQEWASHSTGYGYSWGWATVARFSADPLWNEAFGGPDGRSET